jgi:hypothetical protein
MSPGSPYLALLRPLGVDQEMLDQIVFDMIKFLVRGYTHNSFTLSSPSSGSAIKP